MKFIADILAAIGNGAATVGTQGCYIWFIDEPEMPKSLLDK
ncbi:MAG: cyclic lactone autoinducer peptide [Bacilli bacterium]|nr:cyclic lactone autoinducer peptide [Bacilli bacterium]